MFAPLSRKQMAVFILLGISLALSKMVYLPGALAILLIPASRYRDKKERRRFLIAFSVASLIALVLWALYCSSIYLSYEFVPPRLS